MTKKKITVYSTPTCPYCVMTKEYFKEKGITFQDVDVSQDYDAAVKMVEKSGQRGVPVIDIEGDIVVGFQPDAFEVMLAK